MGQQTKRTSVFPEPKKLLFSASLYSITEIKNGNFQENRDKELQN